VPDKFSSRFYSLYCTRIPAAIEVRNVTPIDDPYRLLSGNADDHPRVFSVEGGRTFQDLIDTGWGFLFLISTRLVRLLTQEKVTGWSAWNAVIRMPGGPERLDYKGLSVRGRAGSVGERAGQVNLKPRRYGSGAVAVRTGLHFEDSTWDGSDMFVPAGTGFVLCVERVRDLFRDHNVTNASFKAIEKIEQLV